VDRNNDVLNGRRRPAPGGIPSARDAAKRIEAQQRDLTDLIGQAVHLRRKKFSGLMVVRFKNGIAEKIRVKADE